ncbi:MAG: hypothetical protein APF84_05550 [Gracilibacter sp. BRH_c7a]|nr:MAG: hypothetical protein APF84_05550 [Gracilibacter sp. BRH_c7a]
MNDALIAQKYIHEANICKLLSLLYCQPNQDTIDTVEYLEQEISSFCPEKIGHAEKMRTNLEENTLEEMEVAHAKLFVGPFDLIAPPYGSVYLDDERRVMGDSTMDALNIYRQAGLNPDPDFKEPPDHITTELEFLYYVTAKYLESEDSQWLELRHEFVDKHLNRWLKPFVDKVEESNVVFYPKLAILTKDILANL